MPAPAPRPNCERPSRPEFTPPAIRRGDWTMAICLGVLAAILATLGLSLLSPDVYRQWDVLFQADTGRVVASMTDRWQGPPNRTEVHPVFAILGFLPAHALMTLGLSPLDAAKVLVAACASASTGLLYLSVRGLGPSRLAASVFTLVFMTSAAFVTWFSIVETYAFAAVTICFLLFMMVYGKPRQRLLWVLASAATLSVTTTNWLLGLAGSFFRLPFRTFLLCTLAAFALIGGLALVQNRAFHDAKLFFDPGLVAGETMFLQTDKQMDQARRWTPLENLRSEVIVSAVAPQPMREPPPAGDSLPAQVNNQSSPMASAGPAGLIAVACWLFLLACGVWGAVLDEHRRPIALGVGAFLVGQMLLHLVYGDVTFLYSLDFFPALIALAAFSWFTPVRRWAVAAAAVFVVFGAYNNMTQFQRAAQMANQIVAEAGSAAPRGL